MYVYALFLQAIPSTRFKGGSSLWCENYGIKHCGNAEEGLCGPLGLFQNRLCVSSVCLSRYVVH